MRLFTLFMSLFVFATSVHAAPNLGGLKLGDTEDALKQITLPLESKTDDAPGGPGATAYKYSTANGNDLSVTFKDGKAVWIENDWKNDPDGNESLIKGLVFDKFTVKDIDALMGSNGYAHRALMFHQMGDMLATFNCYGLSDQPGTSIVFISSISTGTKPDDVRASMSQIFRLRSIVLADDSYLDRLWGPEINKDTAYHEVPWSAVDKQPSDATVATLKHSVDVAMSVATTQETGFSIVLPVGFHREPSPHADANLYVYDDAAESHRMISLDLDGPDARKRDAPTYLNSAMAAFSMMHEQFQRTEPVKTTVSGMDFTCSDWSGVKGRKLFGGRVCVAQKGDGHIMYTEMDLKHRYDDDAAIYQQVFESLKLQ